MVKYLVALLGVAFSSLSFANEPVSLENRKFALMKIAESNLKVYEKYFPKGAFHRSFAYETITPVLSLHGKGTCTIIINSNDYAQTQWEVVFGKYPPGAMNDLYYFSVLHEMGHCLEKDQPIHKAVSAREPELYSDVFALTHSFYALPKDRWNWLFQTVISAKTGKLDKKSDFHTGEDLSGLKSFLESNGKMQVTTQNIISRANSYFNTKPVIPKSSLPEVPQFDPYK